MIKKLFYLSLFFIVTEGILRKWFLPSLSMQIYMLKYLVVLVLWIAFFTSNYAKYVKKKEYPYYLIGFLFFTFAVLDYFMSYFSIKVWLIGMLSYFGFTIYILVVPIVIKDQKTLNKLMTYLIYVSFVAIIVGFIQFYLPPSHPLNTYAAKGEAHIALAGGMVRITSIFNYITGNSTFLSFVVPLLFIYSIIEKNIGKKIILTLLLLIGLFDTFATGSRLTVFFILFSIAFIAFFMLLQRKSGNIKRLMIYGLSLVIITTILTVTNLLHLDAFFSFMDRISAINDSSSGRVLWMLESVASSSQIAGAAGFGIGSTNQISIALGESILNIASDFPLDQPMGRIIFEIGYIGFMLYTFLLIAISWDAIKKILTIHNKQYQLLALTIFITLFQYFTFMNNVIFNWMGAVHFWLGLGLIIAIKRIDKKEKTVIGLIHG